LSENKRQSETDVMIHNKSQGNVDTCLKFGEIFSNQYYILTWSMLVKNSFKSGEQSYSQ